MPDEQNSFSISQLKMDFRLSEKGAGCIVREPKHDQTLLLINKKRLCGHDFKKPCSKSQTPIIFHTKLRTAKTS